MTDEEHWALWRADPRATPFQSPAWLDGWWRTLGGGERRDVEVRDPVGRLVAALPLFLWKDGGVRRLVPVGAGHSDYLDLLAAPDTSLADFWTLLGEAAEGCDENLLPDLRADSPLLGTAPLGWMAHDEEAEVCPVTPLKLGVPFLSGLSKSQRRKVVHDRHRAERLGGVSWGLAEPGELDGVLDALFALHAARWERAGQGGVLADPRVQAFHRAAAPALQAAGLLRIAQVRQAGRIVAVILGFADGQRWFSYINGVDMTEPGQSYGSLAFACLLEAAAGAGARAFHFLRGEEPYKYQLGARPTSTIRRVLRRA